MKMFIKYSLLLLLLSSIASANTVNVFFAGGQSNAKSQWARGIEDALVNSNSYQNVLVVHTIHPGDWLYSWYSEDAPNDNYKFDFFNDFGTATLQTALSADNTVLSGFFWFQGEGDTGSQLSMDLYANRFKLMVSNIIKDAAFVDNDFHFALTIIDAEPTDISPLTGGRTMDDVNRMRQIQKELAGGYSFDSRDYERRDVFHLTSSALYEVGYGLGQAFAIPVPILPSIIYFLSAFLFLSYLMNGSNQFSRQKITL